MTTTDEPKPQKQEERKPDSADLNDLFERLAKIFDDSTERFPKPWPRWF